MRPLVASAAPLRVVWVTHGDPTPLFPLFTHPDCRVVAVVRCYFNVPYSWRLIAHMRRHWRYAGRTPLQRAAQIAGAAFAELDWPAPGQLAALLDYHRADLLISYMAPILPPEVFALPRLGSINLHPSILPAYPGACPLFWQIHDGIDQRGGCTIHRIDAGIDTGEILVQRHGEILAGQPMRTIERHLLQRAGWPALERALHYLQRDETPPPSERLPVAATAYARKINRTDWRTHAAPDLDTQRWRDLQAYFD